MRCRYGKDMTNPSKTNYVFSTEQGKDGYDNDVYAQTPEKTCWVLLVGEDKLGQRWRRISEPLGKHGGIKGVMIEILVAIMVVSVAVS